MLALEILALLSRCSVISRFGLILLLKVFCFSQECSVTCLHFQVLFPVGVSYQYCTVQLGGSVVNVVWGLHCRSLKKIYFVFLKPTVCLSGDCLFFFCRLLSCSYFCGIPYESKTRKYYSLLGWRDETFHPCNDVFGPGFIVIVGLGYNCCAALAKNA